MSFVPDASFNVTIAPAGILKVIDMSLSKTMVALGEAFDAHVFISNTTGGTVNKGIAAFFGNYDPDTGDLLDSWGWGGTGDIPPGNSEWIISCTGSKVGIWDVLGCIGSIVGSDFYPEHCVCYLDKLTVY